MSELLSALLDANAFLPSTLHDDLVACHVPFDQLVEGASVERALEERARRGLSVGLIGKSGSGKSGAAAYVFGHLGTDFAPIHAPVFYETDQTVREPGQFARYLLQKLLDVAEPLAAIGASEREEMLVAASERVTTPSRTIGHSGGAGLDVWLLKGEVAREVTEAIRGGDLAGSTDAVLRSIDSVIDAIHDGGLTPIVLIDDTDRWLQVGDIDRSTLVAGFFGTIVRMLAERECGLVVAVHETYLEMPTYREGTRGFLTDSIRIPKLESPNALAQIVDRRVSIQVEAAGGDVIGEVALEQLFHYYDGVWSHSLRATLQALHHALAESQAAGGDMITAAAIDDAAAALY